MTPLLEPVKDRYDIAADILRGYERIEPMEDSCIAADSLVREFIGGSSYDNH